MHRAVRNDSAIGNRPSGASRHGGVSIGLSPFFSGGGGGLSFLYSVRDEHTRLRPHKFSLRPKKTADFKSSFIRTRFSA